MDRSQLITAVTTNAADNGWRFAPREIEWVYDAMFGTVEHPGVIAEALQRGETVVLGSFGSFQSTDGTAGFRPGKALTEYIQGAVP
ncbi:HU family DNA-binding protein [Streptomyces odontomachi]|uniref:HU family DNA-binding protein n=1 Tax=Streptomyces odontomachi TaxID=2944940 RepID=UPI00210D5128|nr:HU family DNA-binding protein [Streptomyces sp. ODS25]